MKAEFEIVKLTTEDVVTTSGVNNPLCGIVPTAGNN